jgi:FtsP/CotA-like multicopper oxidase with cupredoxin domain
MLKARRAREKWPHALHLFRNGLLPALAWTDLMPAMSRRHVLAGLAVSFLDLPALAQPQGVGPDGFRFLRAYQYTTTLPGAGSTAIWGFDGTTPGTAPETATGPALRVKRGEELRIRLINDLPDPTALHWHGVRLPNAMDGVPDLTQPPIAPGRSFDYRFRPPDAGTFWYRPAGNAAAQIGRGLRGALIVEESAPVAVDRDLLLVFEDWPLAPTTPLTLNGAQEVPFAVRTNERLRLRLINATLARGLVLRIERHAARVMAIDGQPAEPFLARDGRVALAPGNRADVFVDMLLARGERATILLEEAGAQRAIARFDYGGEPARATALSEAPPLPSSGLPERLDLRSASRHDVQLDAFVALPAPVHERAPVFSVRRGRVVVLALGNRTELTQTVHLHGHHVRLLDRLDDGWKPYWLDTLTIAARQTDRIAFLADNPGKWLIEAQALNDKRPRTAAWFAVT